MTAATQDQPPSSQRAASAEIRLLSAPVIVGVTGHRDLIPEQFPALESAARAVFKDLIARCPDTRLILFSQLAEGADQLTARIAKEMGVLVIGVLPMPREMYRVDFSTPEALRRFETSASACAGIIQRPVPAPFTIDEACKSGAARNACYAAAGTWMVLHCHLLLALWDGAPAGGHGGTAEVVDYMLAGAPLDYRPGDTALDTPRVGPVIQIVTPRIKNPRTAEAPFSARWLFPETYLVNGESAFNKSLKQINRLNLDLQAVAPDSASTAAPELDLLTLLSKRQSAVDAAAVEMKKRSSIATILTTVFGLLAVALRALQTTETHHQRIYFRGFAICFAVAVVVFIITKNRQWHRRFLDYRSLAEALRVLYVWRMAGVQAGVHDSYLRSQRGELAWLRATMSAWELTDQTIAPAPMSDLLGRLKQVHAHWVTDQLKFFNHRAVVRRIQSLRVTIIATILISVGLAQTGASLLLDSYYGHPTSLPTLSDADKVVCAIYILLYLAGASALAVGVRLWMTPNLFGREGRESPMWTMLAVGGVLIGAAVLFRVYGSGRIYPLFWLVSDGLAVLAPLTAAALQTYGRHHAFAEESRHYGLMQLMFHSADVALRADLGAGKTESAQRLIEVLGRESLAETADWLLTHRDRPVTLARP